MQYVWDPAKRLSNLKKHGVDFVDAIAVLEDELALTISQIENGEIRFKTVGVGIKPGVLLVIHTEDSEDTIAIVSARPANRSERHQYFEGTLYE